MIRPEHYRAYSAVFPILLRDGAKGREVLLHLRQNTGYMDGTWDFAGSGHVDENETARQAVARECREELGITVAVGPVFMEVLHEYPDLIVHLTLFRASIAEGTPQKLEHNDIRWITPDEIGEYPFCPADEEILRAIRVAADHN